MNDNIPNNDQSVFPTGIRYGLIGILLAAVYSIILYFFGLHYNIGLGMAGLLFPIIVISFGIRSYKTENNGRLTFAKGLWVGMLIALIYAIGAFVFTEIFTNWIVDNYWEGMTDAMEDMFERFGMSDEQIEKQLEKIDKRQKLGTKISNTFLTLGIIGFIISAIASAIMKTGKKD